MTGAARPPLLLYLAHASDPQRLAVGPALAAAAERAGWDFECYHDAHRRGRHFGGGDAAGRPGLDAGGLVAGGRHRERTLRLVSRFAVAALGDGEALLWPMLEAAGVEVLTRSQDPVSLFAAALKRLGQPVPSRAIVLDASPQGSRAVVTAPYLYPSLLAGDPALALEVTAAPSERAGLESLGVHRFEGLAVAPGRAFPGGLDSDERLPVDAGWAAFTAAAAQRHAAWGQGVLLADPSAVAGQLPKARRLRLLPLHGRPQVDAVAAARGIVAAAAEPVFGRQWDDRDFFALAETGHGLQVVDPGPPYDAVRTTPLPEPGSQPDEPSDEQLSEWASEGRVLVTLLLWCGMLRELDCIPQLLDLTAESGLRAGLVITAETVEQGGDEALSLLAVPPDRGGVLGRLELVLGSTGRGVAAESHLPPGVLAAHLRDAVAALADRLPAPLRPRGWWPLLDAPLVRHAELPVGRAGGRPVVRDRPRSAGDGSAPGAPDGPSRRDLRALAGTALRATRAASLLEERRPYDGCRPGALDEGVVDAVRGAGLEYMWSKTTFGTPRAVPREDGFVVLPFTAGRWDGWSPFYTAGHVRDLRHAEKRLRRHGAAGWLATTVDSPLFALSGEVWQHGARLYDMVSEVVAGGASGELVNVTPNVVARYARLLADRTA